MTLAAGAAHAGNLLTDSFDSENGGLSKLNYTGFANFNPTGNVDLVATPDFNITCAGGAGSCVDLAGTPGPGRITSKNFYAVAAGSKVTLSFDVSGNQRVDAANSIYAGFFFASNTTISDYTLGGGFGSGDIISAPFLTSSISTGTLTSGENQPFTNYSLTFTAVDGGNVQLFIGTDETSVFGPVLDNVSLSATGVPEPASWALMLVGFGGLGAAIRGARRRTVSTAA